MTGDRTFLPVGLPKPTDLPHAGAITPAIPEPPTAPPPGRPRAGFLASAYRLTGNKEGSPRQGRTVANQSTAAPWQADAWDMYRLVGEVRFLTNVLASQGAKAKFYVGTLNPDPTLPPIPTTDKRLQDALEAIGDGPTGLAQIVKRLLMNLGVAGDGWLIGIPEWLMPDWEGPKPEEGVEPSLDDLAWRMLSVTEVMQDGEEYVLKLGRDDTDKVRARPSDLYMIRVWNPDPAESWEADSPIRSSLPVLRELVGLTMHIAAQIDSRLAGAGVLLAPQSAADAARRAANLPENSEEDPFTDSLIEGMMTPIRDRSNASAYVPLVWTVPDASVANFKHLSFGGTLDSSADDMRTESIRRYALGADAPAELLLGVASMNHWGAWLVKEETVRTHLEPPLAVVADALTSQYLHPIMKAMNAWTDDVVEEHVVWFDVEDLIVEPSRKDDAMGLFEAGIINDKAVREAYGYTDADAPPWAKLGDAQRIVFEMVRQTPTLMVNPGLQVVLEQIEGLIAGQVPELPAGTAVAVPAPAPEEPVIVEETAPQGPPEEVADPPALVAAVALAEATAKRDLVGQR